MKRNIIIVITVCLLAGLVTYAIDFAPNVPSAEAPQQEAKKECVAANPAPDFAFTDTRGTAQNLSDHQGKIVILNFWASWCAPCLKEFPHFLSAVQDYPEDIVFIGASSDFNADAMTRFTDEMKREYAGAMAQENMIIFHDENQAITLDLFQTLRLPETILIDRNGGMVKKIIGAEWTYDDLRQDIDNIVNYADLGCDNNT